MSLKRLIGAGSGVIFKGAGFYQTDYRSEKPVHVVRRILTESLDGLIRSW